MVGRLLQDSKYTKQVDGSMIRVSCGAVMGKLTRRQMIQSKVCLVFHFAVAEKSPVAIWIGFLN